MLEPQSRLFIALYTDADVNQKLAQQLRACGFDAISARDLNQYGLTDREQLDYAIEQRRAILTFNIRDFAPLCQEYWAAGKEHYGIIVSAQLPFGELLRRTLKLLNAVSPEEMRNNFKNLGEFAEQQ